MMVKRSGCNQSEGQTFGSCIARRFVARCLPGYLP